MLFALLYSPNLTNDLRTLICEKNVEASVWLMYESCFFFPTMHFIYKALFETLRDTAQRIKTSYKQHNNENMNNKKA